MAMNLYTVFDPPNRECGEIRGPFSVGQKKVGEVYYNCYACPAVGIDEQGGVFQKWTIDAAGAILATGQNNQYGFGDIGGSSNIGKGNGTSHYLTYIPDLCDGVTLYAHFSSIYKTTYNKNNSSASGSNSVSVEGETVSDGTAYFSLRGWHISSWNSSSSGAGTTYQIGSTLPHSGLSLYARWTKYSYQPVIAGGGGTAGSSPTYQISSSAQTKTITLPTRIGYRITGWSFSGHNGTSPSISGTTLTIAANTIGNFTATPTWTANTYSVKFNANGGSGTMANESFTYGAAKALNANAFSRTGYTFIGWSTSSSATSATYTNNQSVSNLTATNGAIVNLYAVWRANNYNLTLTVGVGISAIYYKVNGQSSWTATTTTKTVSATYNTTWYAYATAKSGYTYTSTSSSRPSSGVIGTSGASFSASATANVYIVTLNMNGGSGGTTSVNATYDSMMPLVTMPTRPGHTFNGYFDAASGGTKYYNANGTSARTWNKTSNATLYAQWTIHTHKITFRLGEGIHSIHYSIGSGSWQEVERNKTGSETKDVEVGNVQYGTTYKFWAEVLPQYMDGDYTKLYHNSIGTSAEPIQSSVADSDKSHSLSSISKIIGVYFNPNGGTISNGDNFRFCRVSRPSVYDVFYKSSFNIYPLNFAPNSVNFESPTITSTNASPGYWCTVDTRNNSGSSGEDVWHAIGFKPTECLDFGTAYLPTPPKVTLVLELDEITGKNKPHTICANATSETHVCQLPTVLQRPNDTGQYDSLYFYNINVMTGDTSSVRHSVYTKFGFKAGDVGGNIRWRISMYGGTNVKKDNFVFVPYRSSRTFAFPTPTKTGNRFVGWFDAASGGSNITADDKVEKTENTILYAHWAANTYTITLDYGYGVPNENITNCVYDENVQITAPTRENYNFAGWKVSYENLNPSTAKWGASGSTVTSPIVVNSILANGASGTVYVKNMTTINNAIVTLVAQWTRKRCTITISNSRGIHYGADLPGAVVSVINNIPGSENVSSSESSESDTFSFIAYAGILYTFTAEMKQSSRSGGFWVTPRQIGGNAFTRKIGEYGTKAKFTFTKTFSDSDVSADATWHVDYAEVAHNNPVVPEGHNARLPVFKFARNDTDGSRIEAESTTTDTLDFVKWTVDPSSAVVGQTGQTITVNTSNGTDQPTSHAQRWLVKISPQYQLKNFTVRAIVGSATLYVANPTVKVSSGTTVLPAAVSTATVAYGGSVTFSISNIPQNYIFAGWFTSDSSNAQPISTSATFTKTSITSNYTLYAKLKAKVSIRYVLDGTTIPASIMFNGVTYAGDTHDEFVTIGDTASAGVSQGEGSYFINWYNSTDTQHENPLPYGKTFDIVVNDTTSIYALIMDDESVYYLAVYNRDASSEIDDSLGNIAVSGSSISSMSKNEYETAIGGTALGNGKFYLIASSQNVRISATKNGSLYFRRFMYRPLESQTVTEIQRVTPVDIFVNRNIVVFSDWGSATAYNVRAEMNASEYPSRGFVDVRGEFSSEGNDAGSYVERAFESGSKAIVEAFPANGYKFDGWYSESTFDTKISSDPIYEFNVTVDSTYYAKFVQDSIALYKWEGSSEMKELRWKSKVYALSRPANFTSVRIDSTGYVDESSGTPRKTMYFKCDSFSSPNSDATSTVEFGDENTRIADQGARRLPVRRPERFYQIEVANKSKIDAIIIGTNGPELAQ